MRLGAPLIQAPHDPQEAASRHVALGYRSAMLAETLPAGDTIYLRDLERAYAAHDVVIAEVIAWRNLLAPDEAQAAAAYAFVRDQLVAADEIGARCCLTFTGSHDPSPGWTPHPDNLTAATFEQAVVLTRRLLDEVQPQRTKLAMEMMASSWPNSVDSCLALLRAVDRPGFGLHCDPVNLIYTPELYFDHRELLRDCFARLGPYLVSCHLKDLIWRPQRGFHLDEALPGQGCLDLAAYLREVARLSADLPVLLEHLDTPEQYQQAFDHVSALAAGLSAT